MAAYGMILCGASKSIFADALTQQICEGRILHFENATQFTRWLFKQPRGSTISDTVLVAGFREAKPCMDAIIAMRSGDTSKLRTDPKRPQLSEAEPNAKISAAVVEMAVVVQKEFHQYRVAKWVNQGQLDPSVRVRIAIGSEQLRDTVAAALPAQAAAVPAHKLWADMNDAEDWSDLLKGFSDMEEEKVEMHFGLMCQV